MATKLKWCALHRIGYNTVFDAICPQCLIARIPPGKQYDFDALLQKPLDRSGKPAEPDDLEA